jgi:hypothetical protein
MLELDNFGVIDYCGRFDDKQKILDYAEHITYFCNQKEIDTLSTTYDCFVKNHRLTKRTDFDPVSSRKDFECLQGSQWHTDQQCFFNVVRETYNAEPFIQITEKTLKSFLHQVAVIPLGFEAVERLESLGFWFPHDIMDYRYQSVKIFSTRIDHMLESLLKVTQKYTLEQLSRYYQAHLDQFNHNANLVEKILNHPGTYQEIQT